MKVKSNAKINLSLKVCEKIDTLHKIESIMVPISIYDKITIEENESDVIYGMDIPYKENIMYKALSIFKSEYKVNKCYKILIEKEIPIKAGLGGGSSNAACILKALGKEHNICFDDLVKLSAKIGSDVTFFMYNKPSYVSGTGDMIKPYDCFAKLFVVIIFDNDMFSAKEMYEKYDLLDEKSKLNNEKKNYFNDLEKGLSAEEKEKIESIKRDLILNGAVYSLMSGSGGSVFGIFKTKEDSQRCEEKLKEKYGKVVAFETI